MAEDNEELDLSGDTVSMETEAILSEDTTSVGEWAGLHYHDVITFVPVQKAKNFLKFIINYNTEQGQGLGLNDVQCTVL